MVNGLIVLIWVVVIGYALRSNSLENEPVLVCENYTISRAKKSYCVLLFLLPFIFASFRTSFSDTQTYFNIFNNFVIDDKTFKEQISFNDGSELFYALEYNFKRFISDNPQAFFLTIALIQSILLVGTLRKYSEDMGLSIYVFVTSAMYLSWMCNGIRQFVVVTILFAMTSLILNNKWYIYFPVLLFLIGLSPFFKFFGWDTPHWLFCGIHQSAVIMLPIYFVVRGKALTKKVWILLFVLLVVVALGGLDGFIERASQNTMYANDMQYVNESGGMNPIRFLVSLVPVILVIIKRKEIITDDTPSIINLSINMSFVSSVFYLASIFTSGIYIGRFPIYFELYNLILIPWLLNHPYSNNKKPLTYFVYAFYLAYYLYQLFVAWNMHTFTIEFFGIKF